MSQPSEPPPEETQAPKGGRTKLIVIVVAIVVALVAIAAAAVYYFGLGRPCGTAASYSEAGPQTLSPVKPVTSMPRSVAPTAARGVSPTALPLIKVGFTISLTGTYSVEGTNSLNGIKTAADWINSHGGVSVGGKSYNISLDYYDDQSGPAGNIGTLYTKIIQQDGAQFLLAPYSSPLSTPSAPAANNYERVMHSHGGSSDIIWTQTSRRNLVEVLSPASLYLKGAIDWLKANHPSDKIAALYASDSFSSFATQAAIGYAVSQGFTVVYNQSYPTTVTDLSTQLTAAKNAGADDLIGGGHFNDGLLIMNQLKTTWTAPAPKFISLLVAVTEPNFQTQLTNANYVTGPSQWESVVTYSPAEAQTLGLTWYGPTPAEFTQLYGSLNGGATPAYHAGEAGAALLLLASAIQQANSLNTTDVRAELGSMHIMDL